MIKTVPISIVVPVFCGADYLRPLVESLNKVSNQWIDDGCPLRIVEAIFVCDAPIDQSELVLKDLAKEYPWVRSLMLSRNFGQHPATMAGISYSSGDWVISLDEDLQHHPRHIESMLRYAVTNHLDVVYAKPQEGPHQSAWRDQSSRLYKKLIEVLTGNQFIPLFNSFRLMRGTIARASASVCSSETYFDIALCWYTGRIGAITFAMTDQRFVASGKSSYNFRKLIRHARQMLTTSENKHLRWVGLFGLMIIGLCNIMALEVLVRKFIAPLTINVKGWTSLFLETTLLGGLTVFLLSVLLEYVSIILHHVQGKPPFFVVDRSNDVVLSNFFQTHQPRADL